MWRVCRQRNRMTMSLAGHLIIEKKWKPVRSLLVSVFFIIRLQNVQYLLPKALYVQTKLLTAKVAFAQMVVFQFLINCQEWARIPRLIINLKDASERFGDMAF